MFYFSLSLNISLPPATPVFIDSKICRELDKKSLSVLCAGIKMAGEARIIWRLRVWPGLVTCSN